MEEDLIEEDKKSSGIREVLEHAMIRNPKNWVNYHHGSENDKKNARKYSFSDRCRYYMNDDEVQNSIVTPADYYITSQGNYSVRCQLLEKNVSLIDLNISVPTLEAAEAVCKAWPLKYQKIYDKLMEELL